MIVALLLSLATLAPPQLLGDLELGVRDAVIESGFTPATPSIEIELRATSPGAVVGSGAPRLLVQIRPAGASHLVVSEKLEASAIEARGDAHLVRLGGTPRLEVGKSYVLRIKVRRPVDGGARVAVRVLAVSPESP